MGNLYSYLMKQHTTNLQSKSQSQLLLSIVDLLYIASDIVHGLKYLHEKCSVACRDLKSVNILLTTVDENEQQAEKEKQNNDKQDNRSTSNKFKRKFIAKISDFGMSVQFNNSNNNSSNTMMTSSNEVLGSPLWMAPEVYMKTNTRTTIPNSNNNENMATIATRHWLCSADIYSYGIILYELLSTMEPYWELQQPVQQQEQQVNSPLMSWEDVLKLVIVNNRRPLLPPIWSEVAKQEQAQEQGNKTRAANTIIALLYNLYQQCVDKDSSKRPTLDSIINIIDDKCLKVLLNSSGNELLVQEIDEWRLQHLEKRHIVEEIEEQEELVQQKQEQQEKVTSNNSNGKNKQVVIQQGMNKLKKKHWVEYNIILARILALWNTETSSFECKPGAFRIYHDIVHGQYVECETMVKKQQQEQLEVQQQAKEQQQQQFLLLYELWFNLFLYYYIPLMHARVIREAQRDTGTTVTVEKKRINNVEIVSTIETHDDESKMEQMALRKLHVSYEKSNVPMDKWSLLCHAHVDRLFTVVFKDCNDNTIEKIKTMMVKQCIEAAQKVSELE